MSLLEMIEQQRKKHFPLALPMGMTMHVVPYKEFIAVVMRNWASVFDTSDERNRYFQPPAARKSIIDQLRINYATTVHHEFLIFKDHTGKDVGWFVGEAEDDTTFYLRNGGGVPEVRGLGGMKLFLPKFLLYLRDIGYERVTSEHHPNNVAVCIAMLKSGFVIQGMTLDERSGPLIKMVCYLQDDRKRGFESVFRLPAYDPVHGMPSKD